MKKILWVTCAVLMALFARATGFQERFALADDRGAVLQELLPGSDDAFYYKALNELNRNDFKSFQATMESWKRERQSQGWPIDRARELLNREAVLNYAGEPQASLKYLKDQIHLQFNHSRKDASRVINLPSAFDNRLIARDKLLNEGLKQQPRDVSRIEKEGYFLLEDLPLSADQRLDLLKRLERPDFKGVVDLIAADLKERQGATFGSLEIHSKLTLAQLDELAQKSAGIWRSERFVDVYLVRLLPPDEVDMATELDELDAYYERLWGVVKNLTPDFNSRKANILCNWIKNDLSRGVFNKARFLEYVKYPRAMHYAPRLTDQQRPYVLNFNERYSGSWLPPIGDEEPLVRKGLLHIFAAAEDYKEFTPYFREEFLRAVFAEAKVTTGQGTPEQWVAWMSRSQYDAIKRRVDVDFADENPLLTGRDTPVVIKAYIKNVPSLIVKVYEINTENCFRESGKPVDLAMDLSGLTASHETVYEYKEPGQIRVKREYQFPELKERGVYIIELIGNGKSSRALVQKGHLNILQAVTAGGHAFTVFNEDNKVLKGCTGWFNGAPFKAADDGRIYIPFASANDDHKPDDPVARSGGGGQQKNLVVSCNGFSALLKFTQLHESYALNAGFYVDREALIAGEQAEVAVRPRLTVNGRAVALSLLEEIKLTITSVDLDGVESKSVVNDVALNEEAAFVYKFRVPERCVNLTFTLEGKVENLALNQKQDLSDSKGFSFNSSERGGDVYHLFLSRNSQGYSLAVRGKNGEPVSDVPVNLDLKHRLFTREVSASLKSDKAGLIQLGPLEDIESFRGSWDGDGQKRCSWRLNEAACSYGEALHGAVGETLTLAVARDLRVKEDISLLEMRGGVYVKDWNTALSYKDGFVYISDLPAGDYMLELIQERRKIPVRITAAQVVGGYLVSKRRALERPKLKPLAIASIKSDDKELQITLANPSKYACVHLVADRYMPEFDLFQSLEFAGLPALLAQSWGTSRCYYKSGRDIGDEYRYILDRRQAQKYPGNMLHRPGLLIAPWATRSTDADKENLSEGNEFGSVSDAARKAESLKRYGGMADRMRAMAADRIGSCGFLKKSAAVLYNLKPDKEGVVRVPLSELKGKPYLRVAASDPESLIVREYTLGQTPVATRELRLSESLKPDTGFSQKQRVTVLKAGESLEIKDAASARFEIYDTVGKLYNLYSALSKNENLQKFAFITGWPGLAADKKSELYTKYTCHELNLFLYFKDKAFFNSVIKPFVSNKKDKRFVDHWLLGSDLTRYESGRPYASLNAAERSLLAQRTAARKDAVAREIREQVELRPVDQERINRLFDTALQGRALDSDSGRPASMPAAPPVAAALAAGKADKFMMTADSNARRSPAPMLEKAAAKDGKKGERQREAKQMVAMEIVAESEEAAPFAAAGLAARSLTRRLFQKLESTKEWAENNYYELPVESQNATLIKPDVFWQEYAEHKGEDGFVSAEAAEAADSFSEMMLALAVMDLPFEAAKHQESREAGAYKLVAGSVAVVYHREILASERAGEGQALVAQRFFRADDRYRHEGNERFDKMVTEEFLKRVVYGTQAVLTNPTGGRLKLQVLLQIPQGSIPVNGGFITKGFYVTLEPYATHQQEYYFYFPESGKYSHYPVTVARDEKVTGQAPAFTFNVVDELSTADKESWAWISQNGSSADVLEFLQKNNINRIDLTEIAWRMKEAPFFEQVLKLLSERFVYNETLWSYGIHHNQSARIAEYLERSPFSGQCGLYIDAPILKLNPVERNFYEHLEYEPLVNARAHKLGKEHRIMNTRFRERYELFLKVLTYKTKLSDEDQLATAWAMSLQDRVTDAIRWFESVDRKKVAEQMQYDYLDAYLAFYRSDLNRAAELAGKYADYGVERWRNMFAQVAAQIKEIKGEAGMKASDRRNRDQAQTALAATEPALEMLVESGVIKLKGANIKSCTLNFYPMDIELLFSRSPFVQADGSQFSSIRPMLSQEVAIPKESEWVTVKLPESFASKNVMVEGVAAGVRRHQVYYANTLNVQVVERYGQLTVRHADAGLPVPAVYVKVYARTHAGKVIFFKDGYTDLRGRFDYVSLNGNEIENVEMLAVLVLSEELGAVVREVPPPTQVR